MIYYFQITTGILKYYSILSIVDLFVEPTGNYGTYVKLDAYSIFAYSHIRICEYANIKYKFYAYSYMLNSFTTHPVGATGCAN